METEKPEKGCSGLAVQERHTAVPSKDTLLPEKKTRLKVRELNAGEWTVWDGLAAGSIGATPFASSTYLRCMAELLGREVKAFVVERGNDVLAGIAVIARCRLGSRAVVWVPATPYSALFYSRSAFASPNPGKHTSEHISLSQLIIGSLRERFPSIFLETHPDIDDVRPWLWDGWSASPSFTYVLNLSGELLLGYNAKSKARKFERSGGMLLSEWAPEECWKVLEMTLQRQSVSLGLKREQFLKLSSAMHERGQAWMIRAVDRGRTISARIQLCIQGSATAYDWVAGSSPEGLALGANIANVLRVIDECRERNYSLWNMCGANFETVAKFKSQFGGDLVHGFALQSPRPMMYALEARMRLQAARIRRRMSQARRNRNSGS